MKIARTKIDYELLNKALNEDYARKNSVSYIIMSKQTLEIFIDEVSHTMFTNRNESDDYYHSYCGYPIAICNKVPFGEVEIR